MTDDWEGDIALRVTDDDGDSDIDTAHVVISNVNPVANAGTNQAASEGDTVSFGGSATDAGAGDTHTYTWDFGDPNDATPGSGPSPTHTFADDGTNAVTLTVTDDDGGVGTATMTVDVSNVAPSVSVSMDSIPYVGRPVSFTGSFEDPGVIDPHTYTWDFGDGTPSVEGTLNPAHTFNGIGIFIVTLTVTDDDDSGTATLEVEVKRIIVQIDIKPGSDPNSINPRSKGVITVAILTRISHIKLGT